MTQEELRLKDKNWKKFGPYLSERQWGTVREDYSKNSDAWRFTPHDHAKSRAYRWGEEGLAGISDDKQKLCLALALWNGKDKMLKERLFGLTGPQGNHGEDSKEIYFYLDSTPTHSYMKMLYKYPQAAYPYRKLISENKKRDKSQLEYELLDTGIFKNNRYFDVVVEYAKADTDDILMQVTVYNRAKVAAPIHILPTLWFRNTWAWEIDDYKPQFTASNQKEIAVNHKEFEGLYFYSFEESNSLFTDNETNYNKVYKGINKSNYTKDGINNYIINQEQNAINPDKKGTKAAFLIKKIISAKSAAVFKFRLCRKNENAFENFDSIMNQRLNEADEFYNQIQKNLKTEDEKLVQRQAYAGMMWTKQFYYFNVEQWLDGDKGHPPPPKERKKGRNSAWRHLNNADIISMPDKWEYPWYAAWDLAFHCIPLAELDMDFAKEQLRIFTKEWYMHPNGQLPAYEWNFGDVNPPVHAWATWEIFKMDREKNGNPDWPFLESIFHKLLLNFTWWVNRKDTKGNNIFQGGFLGLDNIGIFDRSKPLPTGGYLEQADGTSWMAMYSLNLMRMAIELSKFNPVYQDLATKFFEHFLYIASAMANIGEDGDGLWDEEDKFFYDVLRDKDGGSTRLKIRSLVGLSPLFAVEVLDDKMLNEVPEFAKRVEWFLENNPKLASLVSRWQEINHEQHLLSLLRGHRMKRLLYRMLDESEFLSEYGIRALSKYHKENPYTFKHGAEEFKVEYSPAESDSYLFGGNSNWRGPIWLPMNYLLIQSLKKFYSYYGPEFKVEYPTKSGNYLTILEIADKISERLTKIFLKDENGRRAFNELYPIHDEDENFKDQILFYEYFDGDTGRGVGASHQTGWTGLIATIIGELNKE